MDDDGTAEEQLDETLQQPPPARKVRALLAEKADSEAEANKLARYDPLRRYLWEIRRHHPLEREEEHELAVRYRETGDREAAFRLVTSNLRLVVKIALMYRRIYRNLLDLIQEGNVGLLQAVKRYDPHRGARLPTYATWWIKAYIIKFLLDNARLVKVGTTNERRKILLNLNREKHKLESMGITPTPRILASNLGVAESEIVEVERSMAGADISLDSPIRSDADISFGDTLQTMEESIDERIARTQFREMLERKFAEFSETISERERIILQNRLIAEEPQTLQQIADIYGITREAVRVAEKKLIGKLKSYMAESFKDLREVEFRVST